MPLKTKNTINTNISVDKDVFLFKNDYNNKISLNVFWLFCYLDH